MQVKVIADSISKEGKRITTFELIYPRFIHAEMLRHRVFSRTVESSRAKPIKKNLDEVKINPVLPRHLTINEPGMVGTKEITDFNKKEDIYDSLAMLANMTVTAIEFLEKEYHLHKQVLNRYLEPFLNTKEVVTSTEWDNFFTLRLAPDAEPHIQELAALMKKGLEQSIPKLVKENGVHLPYVTEEEKAKYPINTLMKISSARCARCSYKLYDGTTDVEKDLILYEKLRKGKHLSPMEHVAIADYKDYEGNWANPEYHGNFVGWCQHRKYVEVFK
jgi:thymidylate synthase ThyX